MSIRASKRLGLCRLVLKYGEEPFVAMSREQTSCPIKRLPHAKQYTRVRLSERYPKLNNFSSIREILPVGGSPN